MSKSKTVEEVLIAAKWLLQNVGWVQNLSIKFDHKSGKVIGVCAGEALFAVEAESEIISNEAILRLGEAIGMRDIVAYNDDPSTTKEEVLAAFDRAIQESK